MANLNLKTALRSYGHTAALRDGAVKPRGADIEIVEVPTIVNAFRRMVRGLEFDVSEMAMSTYICARAHGKPFTAIPVFVMRALHHGAIMQNTAAGLTAPKDLEGKRVGVNRGYTVTTGVWARSILQHQYGVDLDRVTWVLSGDEHVEEWRRPPNVVSIEAGQKLDDLLTSGALPAAIGIKPDSPAVKPLIPDAEEAGFDALRRDGLYPINHTVVVKDELLAAHPDLAADLFRAFAENKRLYVERLRAGIEEPTAADAFFGRVMEVTGDPLPYGLEPNRKMIETIIRSCLEQGIISRPFTPEELFPASTHALTA